MTEAEWLSATRVYDLTHQKRCRDPRKRRLFACACIRRVLHHTSEQRLAEAVEAAERFADGVLTWTEVKLVRRSVAACRRDLRARDCLTAEWNASQATEVVLSKDAVMAVHATDPAQYAAAAHARPEWEAELAAEEQQQLIRPAAN